MTTEPSPTADATRLWVFIEASPEASWLLSLSPTSQGLARETEKDDRRHDDWSILQTRQTRLSQDVTTVRFTHSCSALHRHR
jgi:hypothetical protein